MIKIRLSSSRFSAWPLQGCDSWSCEVGGRQAGQQAVAPTHRRAPHPCAVQTMRVGKVSCMMQMQQEAKITVPLKFEITIHNCWQLTVLLD